MFPEEKLFQARQKKQQSIGTNSFYSGTLYGFECIIKIIIKRKTAVSVVKQLSGANIQAWIVKHPIIDPIESFYEISEDKVLTLQIYLKI